jgi:hypothetical protein
MYNTEYENGVLICHIHRTPISKAHGRFFCLKCQRQQLMQEPMDDITPEEWIDIHNKE